MRNCWWGKDTPPLPPFWLHAKGKLKHILEERHVTVVVCWGLALVIWALLKKSRRSLWSGWLVCTMSNNYSLFKSVWDHFCYQLRISQTESMTISPLRPYLPGVCTPWWARGHTWTRTQQESLVSYFHFVGSLSIVLCSHYGREIAYSDCCLDYHGVYRRLTSSCTLWSHSNQTLF